MGESPRVRQLRERATALVAAGRLDEADDLAGRLLAEDDRDAFALKLRGHVLCARSRFEEAEPWLRRAIAAGPKDPQPYCDLGAAHLAAGRMSKAMAAYEKALKARPDHPAAVAGLADVLERRGRHDRARKLLEPFLRAGTATGRMAALAALLARRAGDDEEAMAIVDRHLSRPDVRPADRQWMLYVLGDARDRLGDADGAFEAYRQANQLLAAPYDPDATRRVFDELIETFSTTRLAAFPRAANDDETPVLVVGMPRSGTTLIEQIIHAHPKARGAGEVNALPRVLLDLPGRVGADEPFPACMAHATAAHLDASGAQYLAGLREAAGRAPRIVDKNLANFKYLGFVACALPAARIVHVRREAMDVCLSCYIRPLLPALHPYASDLGHLGAYYRQYARLMAHWRNELDVPLLELDYAEVIADLEGQARRLVDFLGLEWDERCLRFHEAQRDVTTMSYDQVRRPIYGSAAGRWRRYEKHLEPLRAALGDLAEPR